MEPEALLPRDTCLGNFIDAFGETVMVTGITPHPTIKGNFYISHTGNNNSPFPVGVEFTPFPLKLTDEWKKVLKIEQYTLPEWIKYVHQAQNYLYWYAGVWLLDDISWADIPNFTYNP